MNEEEICKIAVKLISDTIGCIYEYCGKEDDNTRIVTLGEVSGICALAVKLTDELNRGEQNE